MDEQALKDGILLAALPNVVFDGWSLKTLRAAAIEAGHSEAMAVVAFPGGVVDALDHLSDWADRQMVDRAKGIDMAGLRVHERVAFLVRVRLEALEPYREAMNKGLAVLSTHGPRTARGLFRTVSRIWYAAGDSSTDFNWYTKRGLLAGVVTATTLYWLNDKSEARSASWAFLDRRIQDVLKIGKRIGGARRLAEGFERLFLLPVGLRKAFRRPR